jgi:hypothetical protein
MSAKPRKDPPRPEPLPLVDVDAVVKAYQARYPHARPLGHAPWRDDKRTKQLREHTFDIVEEFGHLWPLGPRQVGYVAMGKYPALYTKADIDRIENILNRARRAGKIPFEAISDGRTPDPLRPIEYKGASDFWRRMHAVALQFAMALQSGQRVYIEIWVEVASLADQVARVANNVGVWVFPSSGSASTTFCEAAALRIAERGKNGVMTLVLQIGDHDGSGDMIYERCRADVTLLAADYEGGCRIVNGKRISAVVFERLAVTDEQIIDHRLLDIDGKPVTTLAAARRAKVQGEALHPDVLAAIVTNAINRRQDPDIRAMAQSRSERVRDRLVDEVEELVDRYDLDDEEG